MILVKVFQKKSDSNVTETPKPNLMMLCDLLVQHWFKSDPRPTLILSLVQKCAMKILILYPGSSVFCIIRYTKFEKFWLLDMSKYFEVTLVKQIYSRYFQFVCKNIINWIIFEQDSTVQTRYGQKHMFDKHVFL